MTFKDFSTLNSGCHFVRWSLNHLGNFGTWPYKEHLRVTIMNWGQKFRKCYLKFFSIFSSGCHLVWLRLSRTV